MDIGVDRMTNIIMEMAKISEQSVALSIQAYSKGENHYKEISKWAGELSELQDEVSDLAFELIARYQPVASDLRFIKACMEISYGFFRYGRYALDISQVLEMFKDLSQCDRTTVEVAAKTTREMIRMSIDAFARRDLELAKNIEKLDDFVDDKYRSHVQSLISGSASNIKCAMSATLILRYLERIADHSSYIGDSVVYIVTGERAPRK
jgi:phosphate transport system protein